MANRKYQRLTTELSYSNFTLEKELPAELVAICKGDKTPVDQLTKEQLGTLNQYTGRDTTNISKKVKYQAKKHGWNYHIRFYVSISKCKQRKDTEEPFQRGGRTRLHIHVVVEGTPARTIIELISDCWYLGLNKTDYISKDTGELKKGKRPIPFKITDSPSQDKQGNGFIGGYLEEQKLFRERESIFNPE